MELKKNRPTSKWESCSGNKKPTDVPVHLIKYWIKRRGVLNWDKTCKYQACNSLEWGVSLWISREALPKFPPIRSRIRVQQYASRCAGMWNCLGIENTATPHLYMEARKCNSIPEQGNVQQASLGVLLLICQAHKSLSINLSCQTIIVHTCSTAESSETAFVIPLLFLGNAGDAQQSYHSQRNKSST